MGVVKRSVSFQPEVWAEAVRIAREEGVGVSALVNAAVAYYLELRRGLEAVAEWQAEHAPFTSEEIAEADRILDEAGVVRGPHFPRHLTDLR